ncbi:MAG: hypothetical protein ACTIC1_05660 [Brevibacterium sp.]|uniref:hypothetical protein n=1 Tax=Brevibacterium aurantiacum TaxID=273384 RepID=UPI003F8F8904
MNVEQAQEIIDFAEVVERESFPQRSAEIWADILATMPIDKARVSVIGHYRNSTERLMPGHLTRRQQAWEPTEWDLLKNNFDSAAHREKKFREEAEQLGVNSDQRLKKP